MEKLGSVFSWLLATAVLFWVIYSWVNTIINIVSLIGNLLGGFLIIALLLSLVIAPCSLLLLLIPKIQKSVPHILMICSIVWGINLWFSSFHHTYEIFGTLGIAIGLVVAGVGILPIALIGLLIKGDIKTFFILFGLFAVIIGTRIF